MIKDKDLVSIINEVAGANSRGLSHPHEQGEPSRFMLAVELLNARHALAAATAARPPGEGMGAIPTHVREGAVSVQPRDYNPASNNRPET